MEEVYWSSAVTAFVGKNSGDSFSMRLGFHSHGNHINTSDTQAQSHGINLLLLSLLKASVSKVLLGLLPLLVKIRPNHRFKKKLTHTTPHKTRSENHPTTGFLKLNFLLSFWHVPSAWSSSSVSVLIMVGLMSVRSIGTSWMTTTSNEKTPFRTKLVKWRNFSQIICLRHHLMTHTDDAIKPLSTWP